MSDLAIEWGGDRLVLLQGKSAGGHIAAKNAAVINWPEEIDPTRAPAAAGEWLKGELASHGFSAKQAAVSLPRETVVVRHLELPNIPDAELPDMVKLQAATQVTLPADKYLLDYIPLPPRSTDSRDVLMTTVPTEATDAIKAVLTAAGLEISSIGVSSFHIGELLVQQQDSKTRAANQLHLAVTLAADKLELALLRGPCALATSATRIYSEGETRHKAINAEVNRLRLSAQSLHGGLPISHVWVTPSTADAQALCDFLKGKLNCEGSCFDPLGGTGQVSDDDRGTFAATAGHLLASQGAVTESVNYLAPRKAAQKQDRRKVMLALAGVGLVLALGIGYFLFQRHLTSQDQLIADFETETAAMEEFVKEGEFDLASARKIGAWKDKSMDWIEEIQELQTLMPSREIMLVDLFKFDPGKEGQKFSLKIGGIAQSRGHITELSDALQERGFRVDPFDYEDSDDDDYETKFTLVAVMPMDSDS